VLEGPSPPESSYKDMSSLSPAQELSNIRTEREKYRSHEAKKRKVSTNQITLKGDEILGLATLISLPQSDCEQALFTVSGEVLKLETALEHYHQLAVFLERHYWNANTMTVQFQFLDSFGSTPLLQSIRKCLRMLASLDRDVCFIFEVSLASTDSEMFQDRSGVLEKRLAVWIAEIYKEINETRHASEVGGVYSSRERGDDASKERRVPVPAFNWGF
jgi:hypothetical protein